MVILSLRCKNPRDLRRCFVRRRITSNANGFFLTQTHSSLVKSPILLRSEMDTPPPAEQGAAAIELDEEVEGDFAGSRNYCFSPIGVQVPVMIKNKKQKQKVLDPTAVFDPKSVPYRPVALSPRFRLLFVVHPKGFCVTRTSDVMSAAISNKDGGNCQAIEEFCLVNVPMEHISLISLSSDEALLAVCVANKIHFFAVSALLHKDQKPSFSVSLDGSDSIKDMIWAKKVTKAYAILSAEGKLYYGSCQGPTSLVMNDVDCVDWSSQGNYIVVAKKNIVIVLSHRFKEKFRFFLPFKSVVDDSDVTPVIKVDSIRWIRPDCIAIGCASFSDGEEGNYIVQFITSRGASIKETDESSKPIVISYDDIMLNCCPDFPDINGMHLLLSYLDQHELAFISLRNISRQVGLTCWLPDENNKAKPSIVDILKDSWTLKIDCEDNENNVIVGLAVDKSSQNENARFTVGDKDTEVSPCCVIVCLTIDGSISLFHFASAVGVLTSQEVSDRDEEDDACVSNNSELPQVSSLGDFSSSADVLPSQKGGGHDEEDGICVSKKSELPQISFIGIDKKIEPALSTSEPPTRIITELGTMSSKSSTRNHLLHHPSDGSRSPPSKSPDAQDFLDGTGGPRKPFQPEFKKELVPPPFSSRRQHSAAQAPRRLGNVEEITRSLDNLLDEIEEKAGFTDLSITDQTNSIKELEDRLCPLSERCRIWRESVDDKLIEVKDLLDKTAQVLTRKENIEKILREAMDSRYWELWDVQELSCEMESKLKSIMQREQVLTSQLIELEKHFNTLEFNKFGENRGLLSNQMVLQNLPRNSSQAKSLQSLRNTMHSQLEAAEHLSGCLSEQMASLRIESSEKHDMKRQLFECLDLHPSSSSPSPPPARVSSTSAQNQIVNRDSFANSEPKSVRRQHYSLDQSWTSVEMPKTTVKRMSKVNYEKGRSHSVYGNGDNQQGILDLKRKTETRSPYSVSGNSSIRFRARGSTDVPGERFSENSSRSSGQSDLSNLKFKEPSSLSFPSLPLGNVQSGEAPRLSIDETSKSSVSSNEKIYSVLAVDSKLGQNSDTVTHSLLTPYHVAPTPGISVAESRESILHHGKLSSNLPLLNSKSNLSSEPSALKSLSSESLASRPSNVMLDSKRESPPSLVKNAVPPSPSETVSSSTGPQVPQMVLPTSESLSKSKTTPSSAPSLWSANSGHQSPDVPSGSVTFSHVSELPTTSTSRDVSHGGFLGPEQNVAPDQVEEMEEEAPEASRAVDISLGGLGSFGIGSKPSSTPQDTKIPFGVTLNTTSLAFSTFPSYSMPTSGGEFFRPASFNFVSLQPPAPVQSAPAPNISSGFNTGMPGHSSGAGGFGQPSAIGAGQQAIGSMLGAFGQSRQLGPGLPGSSFTLASEFGAPTGGAPVASGGFAGLSRGFGGFAAAASGGRGFSAAATASQVAAGGFGAFSSNQQAGASGGFSAFGGNVGVKRPPSELLTQMRK